MFGIFSIPGMRETLFDFLAYTAFKNAAVFFASEAARTLQDRSIAGQLVAAACVLWIWKKLDSTTV